MLGDYVLATTFALITVACEVAPQVSYWILIVADMCNQRDPCFVKLK